MPDNLKKELFYKLYNSLMEPLLPDIEPSPTHRIVGADTPIIRNIWPGGIEVPTARDVYREILQPASAPIGLLLEGMGKVATRTPAVPAVHGEPLIQAGERTPHPVHASMLKSWLPKDTPLEDLAFTETTLNDLKRTSAASFRPGIAPEPFDQPYLQYADQSPLPHVDRLTDELGKLAMMENVAQNTLDRAWRNKGLRSLRQRGTGGLAAMLGGPEYRMERLPLQGPLISAYNAIPFEDALKYIKALNDAERNQNQKFQGPEFLGKPSPRGTHALRDITSIDILPNPFAARRGETGKDFVEGVHHPDTNRLTFSHPMGSLNPTIDNAIAHEFQHVVDTRYNPTVFRNYPDLRSAHILGLPPEYFDHPAELRANAAGAEQTFLNNSAEAGQGVFPRNFTNKLSMLTATEEGKQLRRQAEERRRQQSLAARRPSSARNIFNDLLSVFGNDLDDPVEQLPLPIEE